MTTDATKMNHLSTHLDFSFSRNLSNINNNINNLKKSEATEIYATSFSDIE